MMFFKEMVLLGNIILTIIITVESSEMPFTRFTPSYPARDQTFNSQFIRQLVKTETLEVKDKIIIKKRDFKMLTTSTKKHVDKKLKALHKYRIKMQSLLCFNAFIVYYFIRNINMADPSIVNFGGSYEQMTPIINYDEFKTVNLYKLHVFLNRMISVFYTGQFFVPRWFFIILIDLKVYFSNGEWNASFAIRSEEIQDIISYIGECKTLNYLPNTKQDHSNVSIPFDEYEKTENIGNIAQSLCDAFDFKKIKKTERLFTLQNFKLSKFISNRDWVYNYNIDAINWNPIKEQENNLFNFNFCREFIASASFLYQKIIVRIITTKLLIFVWKHITIYFRSVEVYRNLAGSRYCYADLMPDLMRYKLIEFWLLLNEPLNLAIKFLYLYNGPLWNLRQVEINTEKLIDITELETLFNDLKYQLSYELTMLHSNAVNLMIDTVIINARTDIESPTVTQNTKYMTNYILEAKTFLKPLNFYFLQFYITYNNNIIPKY